MKKIFISAGEASGDLHGSLLMRELKKIDPDIKFIGIGGEMMQQEGLDLKYDISSLAVVGVWEAISKISYFRNVFRECLKLLDEEKPDLVLLIDYPGFNLRLAVAAKKRGIKVIYYISPQVWAWGEKRINIIRKYVDNIIVFFKFEEELYKKYAVNVTFIGHPLLDIVKPSRDVRELRSALGIKDARKVISLLPGSREIEVKRHLPLLLDVIKIVKQKSEIIFLLSKSKTVKEEIYHAILGEKKLKAELINNTYDCIALADLVLVSSGTATLETAILAKPMIIIYKTSLLTWLLVKPQMKIPYIGLVNVVAGKKIVPEFVQYQAQAKIIAQELLEMLDNEELRKKLIAILSQLKTKLGQPGAASRGAQTIYKYLQ